MFFGLVAAVIIIIIGNAAFIVPETQSAIVLRFGAPKSVYSSAGLKFKLPFAENAYFVDKRILGYEGDDVEIIASNQERLLVDAFVRYRIDNPQQFYQSVRTQEGGEARLSSIMKQTLGRVLGSSTVDQIVSTDRARLMRGIADLLTEDVRGLGMEIVDVKIRRADLPTQNSQAVFQRMITERRQQAEKTRAEGNATAQQIRAQADRKATEEIAKAEEESQKIQGAADAERNAVFAAVYGKDPEFFAFYRSLLAYEQALRSGDSTILLSPNSEFFRYFNNLRGKR
jgi:membrane protease subunit HflC